MKWAERANLKYAGKVFGKLTIIKVSHFKSNKAYFHAECECGKRTVVCMNRVCSGYTRSCGCLRMRPGSAARELYGKYVKRARQRGFALEFTFQEFLSFVKRNCHYCDAPPAQVISSWKGYEAFVYNGIDRWDNNIGYTKANSVPCCGDCNRQKLEQSGEEFIARCKKIASKFN